MMNYSMSDDAGSMNSIDLLSPTKDNAPTFFDQGDARPSQSNLEQIEEDSAAAAGAPSSSSSPSEQQNLMDPSAIYQIDFDVEHLGKNKPQSKRMAIWKYGIPRKSANGTMTVAGHEAKLTWSTHSGKYTISVDGEEVFANVAKASVLEHKWKWSHSKGCAAEDEDDSVAMRIIACRKPPVRSSKDFRCYEFIIGGKVFRELPVNGVDGSSFGGDFQNEESAFNEDGKLMSILDIVEPGWRASGFA
ncbi:hypothetical protein ACHAXR_000780 [Thalassiosira sp. AJA248-18]